MQNNSTCHNIKMISNKFSHFTSMSSLSQYVHNLNVCCVYMRNYSPGGECAAVGHMYNLSGPQSS